MKLFLATLSCVVLLVSANKIHDSQKREYQRDLSDIDHHEDLDDHDTNYDHEAFLGKEESKRFDELTPEESLERLGFIVDKMDLDKDGKVSNEEMKNWISATSKKYLLEDRDRQWKDYEVSGDKVSWDEYKKKSYGENTQEESDSTKDMIVRDEKRWKVADKNGDGFLDKEEFLDFLHPEEAPHMKNIVIDETLADIDKNKDGFIDVDEYVQDMWSADEDDSMPDWVKSEQENFSQLRDKNKDGHLDREEVADWILPHDYDHVESETKHLFGQADSNNDGYLTKDEILTKHDVFVGSQATDFGDALTRHTEL